MLAQAAEYRETLAIEKAMKERTLDVREWAEKQMANVDAVPKEPGEFPAT